jgi:hypothetical protein
VKQIVRLGSLGGVRIGMKDLDDLLVEVGALKANDMRIVKRRRGAEDEEVEKHVGIKGSSRQANVEDDDDWD